MVIVVSFLFFRIIIIPFLSPKDNIIEFINSKLTEFIEKILTFNWIEKLNDPTFNIDKKFRKTIDLTLLNMYVGFKNTNRYYIEKLKQ